MYQINSFAERSILEQQFVQQVTDILTDAIALRGKATLAVSGGSTPLKFFQLLSKADIAWQHVTISLADERWVDVHDDASNTRLVQQNLCQNNAKQAQFFELKIADQLTGDVLEQLNQAAVQQLLPFDVLILGMGEDGHTASLFPCSEQLEQGLTTTDALLKVQPTTAPHQRISFSLSALLHSKHIFLHVYGQSKKQVLEQAIAGTDATAMPIRAFLHDQQTTVTVLWTE